MLDHNHPHGFGNVTGCPACDQIRRQQVDPLAQVRAALDEFKADLQAQLGAIAVNARGLADDMRAAAAKIAAMGVSARVHGPQARCSCATCASDVPNT